VRNLKSSVSHRPGPRHTTFSASNEGKTWLWIVPIPMADKAKPRGPGGLPNDRFKNGFDSDMDRTK